MNPQNKRRVATAGWLRRRFLLVWMRGPGVQLASGAVGGGALVTFFQLWAEGRVNAGVRFFMALAAVTAVLCALADAWWCLRAGGQALLQRTAAECLRRMEAMDVKSSSLERFLKGTVSPKSSDAPAHQGRLRSWAAVLEGIDRLCRTAERYGCIGRHVFTANEWIILRALRLLESLPPELGDDVALLPISVMLEAVPVYDPEGWAPTDSSFTGPARP